MSEGRAGSGIGPSRAQAREGDKQEAGAPSPRASAASAPLGHVLLAEDNPVNQRVMVRHLKELGYTVDVAADGGEAIAAFRRACYDIVLMDCQMPNVDGFEATRWIRDKVGGKIPILAVTADVSESNHQACLKAGMDEVLFKPIARRVLGETMHLWCLRARGALPKPPRG